MLTCSLLNLIDTNLIMKLLEKCFPKYFQTIREQAYSEGYWKRAKETNEQREQVELLELEQFLGKRVISVSNEWDNPQIGVALRIEFITQAKSPILIVQDFLSNQEVMIMGKTYLYTPQRLQAVLKLNPFEACSLIYTYTNEFDKPKSGHRDENEIIMQTLTARGFFAIEEKGN